MTITWQQVHIGGGGFLTGGSMSADGTVVLIKSDVFGGYTLNVATSTWNQVIRPSIMPSSAMTGQGPNKTPPADGLAEFRFAPSDLTNRWLCYYDKLYKSTDSGATFTAVTAYGTHTMEANNGANYSRLSTPRMDIDPANKDVVYVCTDSDGVRRTFDGGTTWVDTGLPANAASNHPGLILFDHTSGLTSGRTSIVYVAVDGHGLYKSTDGGTTWPGSPMTSSPTQILHLKMAVDGKICLVNLSGSPYDLYKLIGTTFTSIQPSAFAGQEWINFALDPNDSNHIVVAGAGTFLRESFNFGTTWSAGNANYSTRVSTDVPWLATCNESYMSTGELFFDTQVANKLWLTEGIGVWTTSISGGVTNPAAQTWTSISKGIEELVSYYVLCPDVAGALPVFVSGDRAIFVPDTGDPTFQAYQLNQQWKPTTNLDEGPGCDWATSDPTFLAFSAYADDATSSDGGASWTATPALPTIATASDVQRCVACSTPLNWIIIIGLNYPVYTLDGGNTWHIISVAGVPNYPTYSGWMWGGGVNTPIVGCCADRVLANTFYMYNNGIEAGTSGGTVGGIYRSTDGGVNWTQRCVGRIINSDYAAFGFRIRAVPGNAGHLFVMVGHVGAGGGSEPVTSSITLRSTNGGTTWSTVSNLAEVGDMDFGPIAPGGTYPSIFIQGWVFQSSIWVQGVFRSDDNCVTWIPYGWHEPDWGAAMSGIGADKNIFGRVFLGYVSSGYAFADDSSALATSTATLVSSLNPSNLGNSVTFTCTVTGASGTPTGTVTFKNNGVTFNSAALNGSGIAAVTTSAITAGSHTISAVYGGDTTYNGDTDTLTQTVNAAAPSRHYISFNI